jgi:putative membrane protein
VDVVRPFLARIVGLAELKIRLAGSSRSSGRLAYLPELAALDLRARLLAGHHGLDLSTPEPAEVPLASVPTGPLVAAALLAPAALLTIGLAVAIVFLTALSPTAAAALGGFLAVYVLAFGRLTWRRVVEQYGFSVAQAPDGIRVRRGLFSTVAETVPFQRVQAVRKVQPLLWRPWGWCRLEVDVAGSPGREQGTRSGRVTRALLPVGPTSLADGLLWSLLSIRGPDVTAPPRRARLKAPLSYHFLAAGHDGALAAAVTGRVRKVTTWVPLEKIQSIRRVQGPVQRALGLASVHADAAGRHVRAEFRDRDAIEADGLFEDLVLAARSQRRLISGRSPLSATSSGLASPGPGSSGPAVTATRQAGQPPPPPA